MAKVTIRDLDLQGKRVLVRVDYNVPLDLREDGTDATYVITDDTRIKETLPTLKLLREKGARIVLCAHMGRPKGKVNTKESLKPVAPRLAELLGAPVAFSEETVGAKAEATVAALKPGEILLLENTRFHAGEEKNDPAFAAELAKLADVYVNDAFGAAHRAHASTEGVAHLVKERGIGLLMERELKFLGDAIANAAKPFVVILGGAKVSDKIQVIDTLLDKADTILIGGAMAYTFGLALGKKVGKSLTEPDQTGTARKALDKAKAKGVKFLLPLDNYIVEEFDFAKKTVSPGKYTNPGEDIPDGWEGVDIGPKTVEAYKTEIAGAKTILWNGPMGVFEVKECAKGTFAVAEAVAANQGAVTIIGGGDSVKAVKRAGVADKVSFISTGGGASLEFLEGKVLPGVACIPDKA